ncbi:MAG: ClpXP protease specificity-enhancing factor [Legionellales bacterium]|nr:ClpXP protease specificity-enhancing factor [Legionellales bacterium]
MTSSKPYLIRAIYQWIVDNELTPYIVINCEMEGVQVPEQFIEDGRIVFNIAEQACRGLNMTNERIVFSASFNGNPMQIHTPPSAVMAIYAKENGRGMVFTEDDDDNNGGDGESPSSNHATTSTEGEKKTFGKPKLTIVK